MTAKELIEKGYWQVSRKHGHFARLPPGNPQDLLFRVTMQQYRGLPNEQLWEQEVRQWVNRLGDRSCASQYLRVYATDIVKGIDGYTIQEFHKLDGPVA